MPPLRTGREHLQAVYDKTFYNLLTIRTPSTRCGESGIYDKKNINIKCWLINERKQNVSFLDLRLLALIIIEVFFSYYIKILPITIASGPQTTIRGRLKKRNTT